MHTETKTNTEPPQTINNNRVCGLHLHPFFVYASSEGSICKGSSEHVLLADAIRKLFTCAALFISSNASVLIVKL